MDRCVVRQAIKEKETGKITGYELIFQGGKDSLYNNNEASAADTISDFLVANSTKIIHAAATSSPDYKLPGKDNWSVLPSGQISARYSRHTGECPAPNPRQ